MSVYPLVTAGRCGSLSVSDGDSGYPRCELYVYSRSFQVQKECRAEFDKSSNAIKNRYFRGETIPLTYSITPPFSRLFI